MSLPNIKSIEGFDPPTCAKHNKNIQKHTHPPSHFSSQVVKPPFTCSSKILSTKFRSPKKRFKEPRSFNCAPRFPFFAPTRKRPPRTPKRRRNGGGRSDARRTTSAAPRRHMPCTGGLVPGDRVAALRQLLVVPKGIGSRRERAGHGDGRLKTLAWWDDLNVDGS